MELISRNVITEKVILSNTALNDHYIKKRNAAPMPQKYSINHREKREVPLWNLACTGDTLGDHCAPDIFGSHVYYFYIFGNLCLIAQMCCFVTLWFFTLCSVILIVTCIWDWFIGDYIILLNPVIVDLFCGSSEIIIHTVYPKMNKTHCAPWNKLWYRLCPPKWIIIQSVYAEIIYKTHCTPRS